MQVFTETIKKSFMGALNGFEGTPFSTTKRSKASKVHKIFFMYMIIV
ncbi:hypothetical protein [Methanooceanicella nereidis]|nr:hypothetical protein [Methanocella sp. CWC-04]